MNHSVAKLEQSDHVYEQLTRMYTEIVSIINQQRNFIQQRAGDVAKLELVTSDAFSGDLKAVFHHLTTERSAYFKNRVELTRELVTGETKEKPKDVYEATVLFNNFKTEHANVLAILASGGKD